MPVQSTQKLKSNNFANLTFNLIWHSHPVAEAQNSLILFGEIPINPIALPILQTPMLYCVGFFTFVDKR